MVMTLTDGIIGALGGVDAWNDGSSRQRVEDELVRVLRYLPMISVRTEYELTDQNYHVAVRALDRLGGPKYGDCDGCGCLYLLGGDDHDPDTGLCWGCS
jgi:hypothetical protein